MTAPVKLVQTALHEDVISGLLGVPKTLPPKLFYDDRGARLFEQICEQPEYYLTRAELEILSARASGIARLAGPQCVLVEYGSGAGIKIRLLLDELERPSGYVPVDISRQQLTRLAQSIARDYPSLDVSPVCADYSRRFEIPALKNRRRRVAFFPGSTIGNFHPPEAIAFLQRIRYVVGQDGALILGVDRLKDRRALHAAYNDARGVTAEFNLNMLARINRELGGDFDLRRFRHVAFFNERASRIEMHIESLRDQRMRVGDACVDFATGETIWTESSYKYDRQSLEALASSAGFEIAQLWTDAHQRFWVAFLTVLPHGGK